MSPFPEHGRMKPGDRVLAIIIAVAALAGIAWLAWSNLPPAAAGTALQVVCQTKDGFYRVDPLASDVEYTVEADDAESGSNTVRISDGAVDVVSADCSNQICVEHDPISEPGEQIVCLPHGLVIEVVVNESDAVSLV